MTTSSRRGGAAEFAHLHVHTEYSMLDGASRIEGLVDKVAADDQPAVAITDHGVLFGLVEFYRAARDRGVKPILGMEAYLAEGSRYDRTRTHGGDRYYHLTILAASNAGYHNLIKLSTRAYLEGMWYRPRIDKELLEEHAEGLVLLSGCLQGEVHQALAADDRPTAKQALADLRDIAGPDRAFVELMDHGIEAQRRNWPILEDMAADLGLRTVITNDSHYTDQDDADAHDALLCVQTGAKLSDEDRFRFSGPEYWLRTAEEMWEAFGDRAPEALRATLDVAERCNAEISFDLDLLPEFPCPEGMDEAGLLRQRVYEGARRRYREPLDDDVVERIDYELGIIERMGFPAYFLIVADLCDYARDNDIRVGPGRGSAGGSVVSYCTGITQVDPLAHGLIFERFLNPARIALPDIDIDFDDRRRGEMIRYAAERYGEDCVAQIVTFGTIKAKSAIRDAARVLGEEELGVDNTFRVGDDLCKKMPPAEQGRDVPLQEAYEKSTELADAREDPVYGKVLETAEKLEGLNRQHGIHAAAVIIGAEPLDEVVPLMQTDDGQVVTQYEMGACEDLGLLKMDFLGLRNLTVLSDAEDHIRDNQGEEVDVDAPEVLGSMDDPAVYDMLASGDTLGVFQLDSSGMQALVRKLKPSRFEDISALLALYRPGPLSNDMHLDYAERKNGLQQVTFEHPDLEPILGETYGLCVAGDTLVTDAQTGERIRVDEAEDRRFLVQGAHGERGKVTNWVDNGVREVCELVTRSGRRITLTPDHRVLTTQGWRQAGCIAVGDAVAIPQRLEVSGEPRSLDRLRVLAYLLADGSISTRSGVAFCNTERRLLDDFSERVVRAFPSCLVREYPRDRVTQLEVVDDGTGTYRRTSSLLALLRAEGLQGTNSATKFIPDYVLGADDAGVREFLAAYWDCDGHVGTDVAYVKTISPHLAFGLQELLLRLGIHSTVSSYEQSDCRNGVSYQVHVYDSAAFRPIQRRMLSSACSVAFSSRSLGGVYEREAVLGALQSTGLPQRQIARTAGVSRSGIYRRRRWMAERTAQSVSDALELDLDFDDRWDPVVEVRPAGEARVYDLTVEGTHSFVGNGIVVHNCIYQEQVMQIATDLCGFTRAEADTLRKAVGKKKRSLMESQQDQFVQGGLDNGYERRFVQGLWELIEKFAEYGFNKAHSVAYGVIAYQTAYLKANYPVEYMAALLTSVKNHKDYKPLYLNECRRMGIDVAPPDVNTSDVDFTPRGEEIRFGLSAVRGVGEAVVGEIIAARRREGGFEDFRDFCDKVDAGVLNKRVVESLIKAGAFVELGHSRRGLLSAYQPLVDGAVADKKAQAAGQYSLFGGEDDEGGVELDDGVDIPDVEFDRQQLLAHEREMLGLYVSDHPLFGAEEALASYATTPVADLREMQDDAKVTVAGVVTTLTKKFTRRGAPFSIGTLEDLSGAVEVVFWPDVYEAAGEVLREDVVLVIAGRLEVRDTSIQLTADKVTEPDLSRSGSGRPPGRAGNGTGPVVLRFAAEDCTPDAVRDLKAVLSAHDGEVPVHVHVADDSRSGRFALGDAYRVSPRSGLFGQLKAVFGAGAVLEPGG